MNHPHDDLEPAVGDAELDALLADFFRHEMPPELRESGLGRAAAGVPSRRPGPRLVRSTNAGRTSADRPPGTLRPPSVAAGLAVATVCLAMVAVLLVGPGPRPVREPGTHGFARPRTVGDETGLRAAVDASEPAGSETPIVPSSPAFVIERVEERLETVDRSTFLTSDGPVELRTDLRTTNVSAFDEQTGTSVELEFPEMVIEVFPIEDE